MLVSKLLGRFVGVGLGMKTVTGCCVRVMSPLDVVPSTVVLGSLFMVFGGMFVVLGRFLMMVGMRKPGVMFFVFAVLVVVGLGVGCLGVLVHG